MKSKWSVKLVFVMLAMLLSSVVHAKRFANQYTEFELPPAWACALEGSEWVCQSESADRQREAIIILAAKIRGPQDTLDEYMAYLKQEKIYNLPGGKVQKSEPKTVEKREINGQQWVDSLHLASEVPGFYTQYLATVKEDLGVAVTLSVTKDLYQDYKGIFDNVIKSLRVFRQAQVDSSKLRLGQKSQGSGSGFADATFVPAEDKIDLNSAGAKKKRSSESGSDNMIILLAAVFIVGFILLKLKKKK